MALERPESKWVGDGYRVFYPATGIEIYYDRFAYSSAGIMASAVFRRFDGKDFYLLTRTRYNLETSDRIGPILNRLSAQAAGKQHLAGVNWSTVLEAAGALALDAFRTGTPAKKFKNITPITLPRYFLKPYVGRNKPTTIAAEGGTGKTWVAIAAALTACQSKNITGWKVGPPVNVLFGDWENDEQLFWKRVTALAIGNGIDLADLQDTLHYRNLKGVPLIEAISSLSKECEELQIGFCAWDSLFYACGGMINDANSVGLCYTAAGKLKALHQPTGLVLPIPQLFVTHLSKDTMRTDRQEGKRKSPIGTIFVENGSDYVYSLEQPTQTGDMDDDVDPEKYILVTCEKVNHGRYEKTHAYRVIFTNDPQDPDETISVEFQKVEPIDVPDFASKLPMTTRVLGQLRNGVRLTPIGIAQSMPDFPQHEDDEDEDEKRRIEKMQKDFRTAVRVACSRLKAKKRVFVFPDGRYGLADFAHS